MKLRYDCIPCLFDRAKFECDLAFGERNEEVKKRALRELLEFLLEHYEAPPSLVGTQRERIIQKFSRKDAFSKIKEESYKTALEILPTAVEFYETCEDKLEALIRIAAAANSMEYGVKDHRFDNETFKREFHSVLSEKLNSNLTEIKKAFRRYDKILYLTDNAGEIVFDVFVANAFEKLGKRVVLSPKSAPVLNDATADELRRFEAELRRMSLSIPEVVPSGACIGVCLEEAEEAFLRIFWDASFLIFAKGMGNYEALSEFDERLKGRLIYVFRAKCKPVARSVGVRRGELVAKLVV
ncbi:MAG: House-cleaning carbohydrate phosphatase [Candidatus Alkanophagales archaeon MCA70_species_2]|nr:House-cleaning carbohydrate phosphatase [Candidatus Alkanophaga liquidiphilum]